MESNVLAAEKTLSPYFFINSESPEVDRMPLKSTMVKVDIAGVVADVRVTQVYQNTGRRPIEAIYVFPGSTRAAVYGMKMTIGERTIVAEIEKKQQARQRYEQAKQEGRSASLLEQQRPNVFQMNVANIMPEDEIRVELSYTELLAPTDCIYEFVYPTVVGPRYSTTPVEGASPSEQWVENPYLHEDKPPTAAFDMTVNLSTGLALQMLTCSSHHVDIDYAGQAFATIRLDASERSGGNRDYSLKYRLAGGQIESGLLLYEGESSQEGQQENFFLLMVQPPEKVQEEDLTPREYIFIMDVSGSMNGFPMDISKTLVKDLIGNLRPDDRFNLLQFSFGSKVLSESGSLPATEQNIQQALKMIAAERGSGGTEILPALRQALNLPRTEGMARSIIIISDGFVNVESEVFDLIRDHLGQANLFAFGIGTSVNRHLVEGMAHVGAGEPFVITKETEAAAQAATFRRYIQSPVLTNITLERGEFGAYEIEPPTLPDLFAERPIICFGKWRGARQGTLTLSGRIGTREYNYQVNVSTVTPKTEHDALRYLWARHRIMLLGDYNNLRRDSKHIETMTELGLKYSLLTEYTSFVAIDSAIRNQEGESTTIKQPLPLPQGVSDLAVGNRVLRERSLHKLYFGGLQEREIDEAFLESDDFQLESMPLEPAAMAPPAIQAQPSKKKESIDGESEIVESFLVETDEHLQILNDGLLALGEDSEDLSVVDEIFRSANVIKESAAMLGFPVVSQFASMMEELLGKIRSREIKASEPFIDLLLQTVDTLTLQIEHIPDSDTGDESVLSMFRELYAEVLEKPQESTEEIEELGDEEIEIVEEEGWTTTVGKTFRVKNGVWVDDDHTEGATVITIRQKSEAYNDIIQTMPALKPYFDLGEKVIVNLGQYSIEVADHGETTLTKGELMQLLFSWLASLLTQKS